MKKGAKQSKEWIEKRAIKLRGRVFTKEHRKKIADAQKGDKGNNWKGALATYNSVHHWIRDTFGKPNVCVHCEGTFTGRKIEWANVSGEYKRDRQDWIRLCAKCHRKYDRENPMVCKRLYSHA
jgi:hypothetical protein